MSDLARVLEAVSFAATRHRGQRRKGADGSPYISHPIDVARELAATGGVGDVDVLLAARLRGTNEALERTFDAALEMGRSLVR